VFEVFEQAFSSAMFCGASRGSSASAKLLVDLCERTDTQTDILNYLSLYFAALPSSGTK